MLRKCPQPPVPFLGQQAPPPPTQPVSTPGITQLPPNNSIAENSGIPGPLPTVPVQGSQLPLAAGNSGINGSVPTLPVSQAIGNPPMPGIPPVSVQGFPKIGALGVSGGEASQSVDDDFADFQEASTPAAGKFTGLNIYLK